MDLRLTLYKEGYKRQSVQSLLLKTTLYMAKKNYFIHEYISCHGQVKIPNSSNCYCKTLYKKGNNKHTKFKTTCIIEHDETQA